MVNMDQYQAQLLSVEKAIHASENSKEREELRTLKDNLIELIALTQFVDEEKQNEDDEEVNLDDYEMHRFMSEVKEIDQKDELRRLKDKCERMVGEKCSAPYMHSWGAITYHNALICSMEDEAVVADDGNIDVKFRVLFTNPTHKEMLPCPFFLDGSCRFDSENCHFSHGEMVSAGSLREYTVPDFSRLSRNCVVLAKTGDNLWQRGRVLCANYVEKECRVRLDNSSTKNREQDFKFVDLLPIFEEDGDSTSDSESETDYPAINDDNCNLNTFTYDVSQSLGDWERYTRGIGSKLMAKMGYIHGTGLGSNGGGIITPIAAQILPMGKSLDYCMSLREAANGDENLFSAEKKLQKDKKKQEAISARAYERETTRVDVFSFINENVLSNSKPIHQSGPLKKCFQNHSSKSLNVESVKVADDIRRKEREIAEVRKSLKRNAEGGADICSRLKKKLREKTYELSCLQEEQDHLSNEQSSRKTKSFVF
uniref:Zinc finger CCCH-type with G patch domain-containing protein n=1 Tax=Stomoxys calcitrans TaxID=35570 RepID=A0A1I8PVE0_STOCA